MIEELDELITDMQVICNAGDETMDDIKRHYEGGQHAALRGCYRVLCNAPDREHLAAWYAGYDSVPRGLRGSAPLTGPIPDAVLSRLADSVCA